MCDCVLTRSYQRGGSPAAASQTAQRIRRGPPQRNNAQVKPPPFHNAVALWCPIKSIC